MPSANGAIRICMGVDVSAVVADAHARTARDERGILFNYGTPPMRS